MTPQGSGRGCFSHPSTGKRAFQELFSAVKGSREQTLGPSARCHFRHHLQQPLLCLQGWEQPCVDPGTPGAPEPETGRDERSWRRQLRSSHGSGQPPPPPSRLQSSRNHRAGHFLGCRMDAGRTQHGDATGRQHLPSPFATRPPPSPPPGGCAKLCRAVPILRTPPPGSGPRPASAGRCRTLPPAGCPAASPHCSAPAGTE